MSVAEPSGSPRQRGYGPNAYCVHCHTKIMYKLGVGWVHNDSGKEECQ